MAEPTEVIREGKDSSDGVITQEEIDTSRRITSLDYLEYTERKPKGGYKILKDNYDDVRRFRDIDNIVMVNIHTSPELKTSSQGCQNIPVSISDGEKDVYEYEEFMREIPDRKTILYTLIDSSKVPSIGN